MEVCGLKWASDGRFLASGGNDNEIFIWNLPTSKEPVNKLSEHTSAVKVFVLVIGISEIRDKYRECCIENGYFLAA